MNQEKINWLKDYAFRLGEGCQLELDGEVGFGRPCVGIVTHGSYLDYELDRQVKFPEDAYHKHDCLAVLVHDNNRDKAIDQLYDWCQSFEAAGYVKCRIRPNPDMQRDSSSPLAMMLRMSMGQHMLYELVKP